MCGTHREPEAADTHASLMKNCVYQALYCVFKNDVADISDLGVTLRAHARIKNKTESTETFDFTFKLGSGLQATQVTCRSSLCDERSCCQLSLLDLHELDVILILSLVLLDERHCSDLLLVSWINPKDKLFNVVSLRIVKQVTQVWEAFTTDLGGSC